MQVIELYSSESASVSSNKAQGNFNCNNDYLELGNYKIKACQSIKNNVLLQFDLSCIDYGAMGANKAYLNLEAVSWNTWISKSEYEVTVNINEQSFDPKWVNWDLKPQCKYYKTVQIPKSSIEKNEIKIDITDLVELWANNSIPNYGITLETTDSYLAKFSAGNNCESGPKLTIYAQGGGQSSSSCCKPKAIELQVFNQANNVIENGKNVLFDTMFNQQGDAITYDSIANEIVILEKGVYAAQWWISIDGSGNITEINFELIAEGDSMGSYGSAPVFVLNQANGNAIIVADTVPKKLKLLNKSGDTIQYANTTTQASLILFKI